MIFNCTSHAYQLLPFEEANQEEVIKLPRANPAKLFHRPGKAFLNFSNSRGGTKMSRLILAAIFVAALFVFGCQTTPMARHDHAHDQGSEKILIKCATCGVEFTSRAAAVEHMAEHPEHEFTKSSTPLIQCATCGVVFTSAAGLKQHMQEHPEHKAAPLIRCSTCGVDITSPEQWKEHLNMHK
ncbi:MAG TPA: hypothetical protein DDY20_09365 [Desulfobulbaceae bacterium]|nr:hypothetical protein [Desulfobulbaceae bacterium]